MISARSLSRIAVSTIFLVLLTSCATTVKPWTGDKIYTGEGGSMRLVEGVEVWDHGAPDRQFRVVGIIETATYHQSGAIGMYNAMNIDKRIAVKAKDLNADAVIPLSAIGEFSATQSFYDLDKTVAAIKYVE